MMYQTTYKIADYLIRLESEFAMPDSVNAASYTTKEDCADFYVRFEKVSSFTDFIKEDYEIVAENLGSNVIRSQGREYRNFINDGASYAMTEFTPQGATCYYEYEDAILQMMETLIKPLSFCCLERIMLKYGRMILHSSHIVYRGDSILISAPSGTGKSTHAALWEQYYGATVVNGDRSIIGRKHSMKAALQEGDSTEPYYAYGLPMCGSSNIYRNMSCPLKAIVVIRQSPDNYVERPGVMEAFRYIFSETTQNAWDSSYITELMNLIENLINQIPVYVLHCNMERSAADCLYRAIYQENLYHEQ